MKKRTMPFEPDEFPVERPKQEINKPSDPKEHEIPEEVREYPMREMPQEEKNPPEFPPM